jgi:hypothetical protein
VPASYACSNRSRLSAWRTWSSSAASGWRSIGHAPRPARRRRPSAAPASSAARPGSPRRQRQPGEFDDSPVVDSVHRVTGRPPRTFGQWAEAHAHLFTG